MPEESDHRLDSNGMMREADRLQREDPGQPVSPFLPDAYECGNCGAKKGERHTAECSETAALSRPPGSAPAPYPVTYGDDGPQPPAELRERPDITRLEVAARRELERQAAQLAAQPRFPIRVKRYPIPEDGGGPDGAELQDPGLAPEGMSWIAQHVEVLKVQAGDRSAPTGEVVVIWAAKFHGVKGS